MCPTCGLGWRRRTFYYPTVNPEARNHPHFHAFTFKPYVEDGFNGKPVKLETKQQRDELCKEHSLTYDRTTNVRKPEYTPAIDTIDYGDVKEALEHGPSRHVEPDLPYVESENDQASD